MPINKWKAQARIIVAGIRGVAIPLAEDMVMTALETAYESGVAAGRTFGPQPKDDEGGS